MVFSFSGSSSRAEELILISLRDFGEFCSETAHLAKKCKCKMLDLSL